MLTSLDPGLFYPANSRAAWPVAAVPEGNSNFGEKVPTIPEYQKDVQILLRCWVNLVILLEKDGPRIKKNLERKLAGVCPSASSNRYQVRSRKDQAIFFWSNSTSAWISAAGIWFVVPVD
jgi:hypothetical protein